MASLFELTVYRMLREALEPAGYSIRYQATDADALRDGEGEKYRNVRPDMLVFRKDVPVAVIDAKYKDYWEVDLAKLTPTRKVSNEDIYQLFFYASRLQSAYQLASPPPAIIISPVPAEAELNERQIIGDRFTQLAVNAGGVRNHLQLALLPLSSVIRELAVNRGNVPKCPGICDLVNTLPVNVGVTSARMIETMSAV
jgi:hypothetical protein